MTAPENPLSPAAGPAVASRQAPPTASIDFAQLMAQAKVEGGFRVEAKARHDSTGGLCQFIDATWFILVQRFGEKYGIGELARQLAIDEGRATVADPAMRQRVLDLRDDALLSAALATEYAQINKGELARALGRPAANADLYLAHFLGAAGAAALLKAVAHNGDAIAADLLPRAAAAHRSVFFDHRGAARSIAEIYRSFAQRIDSLAKCFPDEGSNAPADGSGGPAGVPGFVRRLGFDGRRLSQPMLAMLNAFALSALQLLAGARPAGTGASAQRSA